MSDLKEYEAEIQPGDRFGWWIWIRRGISKCGPWWRPTRRSAERKARALMRDRLRIDKRERDLTYRIKGAK